MTGLRQELEEAVVQLDDDYDDLTAAARRRLGSLYSAADYPASLQGLFSVDWDFPSVEPPEYLQAAQSRTCTSTSANGCGVASTKPSGSLRQPSLTSSLNWSRICANGSTAKPTDVRKVFRNSAVDNLRDFFERFRSLNVGTNAELDRLVDKAQQVVSGVRPQSLRDNCGAATERRDQTVRCAVGAGRSAGRSATS